ncbi:MAG: hypothetical protein IT384_24655 [Deltaproteobacteria bacterium]|nr:hypothetical protein [Deltaproteobacteria bacterium]
MPQSNADALFEAIRVLPPTERLRLVERVVHELAEAGASSPREASMVVGLFAAEAELMDEVVDSAMVARARDPLRQPGA